MEQINYIYALVDPNTNKVRYIGKTNNMKRRYNEHLNRSKDMKHHSSRWIQSLLHKNQKPIHISIGEYPDSIINIMEIFWINFYNTTYGNLTNHTIGGDGRSTGYKCSNETKKRMSISATGRVKSKDERLAQSQRMTELLKDKTNHPMYGKHFSEESKKKMSLAQSGSNHAGAKKVNQYSIEGKFIKTWDCINECIRELNITTFTIKSSVNDVVRDNFIFRYYDNNTQCVDITPIINNNGSIKVNQLTMSNELIKEWDNALLASNTLKIDASSISRCCKGKQGRAGKFKWSYTDES